MERLKFLRKQRKLTQVQMSEILNVAQSTYAQYESGYRQPDITMVKKIANFFEVPVDYLLENDDITGSSAPYDHEKTKQTIIEELGPGVSIHFEDATKVTPEQLKVIKAVLQAMDDDD